jgi:hypothetical protein
MNVGRPSPQPELSMTTSAGLFVGDGAGGAWRWPVGQLSWNVNVFEPLVVPGGQHAYGSHIGKSPRIGVDAVPEVRVLARL